MHPRRTNRSLADQTLVRQIAVSRLRAHDLVAAHARDTLRTLWTLWTLKALRALSTGWTNRTLRASRTCSTFGAGRTCGTHWTDRACRTCHACGTGRSCGAWRSLPIFLVIDRDCERAVFSLTVPARDRDQVRA